MKKLFVLFCLINFISMPAYCLINDDFTENSLDKNLQIKQKKYVEIEYTFVEKSLDKNLKVKEFQRENTITDTFAEKNRAKNSKNKPIVVLNEQLPKINENKVVHKKIVVIDENDFLKIPVKIKNDFSTKQRVNNGDYLEFETLSEIKIEDKIYPKGTLIKGKIENVSMNDTVGVPANLTVGSFFIDDYPLQGEINKKGANRTVWIYPSMFVCNIFFGLGLLLPLIRGGHAKINSDETYTLYYKLQK